MDENVCLNSWLIRMLASSISLVPQFKTVDSLVELKVSVKKKQVHIIPMYQ